MITRRSFLKGGILLGAGLMIDATAIEPKRIKTEEVPVHIKDLPPEFSGFKICQLTDIHHSFIVGLDYIDKVVEAANSLKPDLTVLTGDYIDEEKKYMAPVIKSLSRLRARHGVVSILGNHDYFIDKDYSMDVIASHKIPLLMNSHMIISEGKGTICLGGTKDFWEDTPDAKVTFSGVEKNMPRILLNHHPDYCEYLPKDERVDLVLCGHTHGGQVRLPFSYAPVLPSSFGQKYSGGLIKLSEDTTVYVSRGVGVVMIPVRVNCPPELTLIRLYPKKA